jgi:hypothetical protein
VLKNETCKKKDRDKEGGKEINNIPLGTIPKTELRILIIDSGSGSIILAEYRPGAESIILDE